MGGSEEFSAARRVGDQATPLRYYLNDRVISLEETIAIAAGIAEALVPLHEHGAMVRGLNPASVVVHQETGTVSVHTSCRFVMNGALSETSDAGQTEAVYVDKSELLADFLPYIAPEQTGKGNHVPDHRTDLYALGTILFEMLTGHPPFTAGSALKSFHAHMATPAASPAASNPEIPDALSGITLKLLEKSPDARYQSAQGVHADLAACLDQLQTTGEIRPFSLGSHDTRGVFKLSNAIYGRGEEQKALSAACAKARQGGAPRIWVEGGPGMGKTTLVNTFSEVFQNDGGLVLSAKFEQTRNEAPNGFLSRLFERATQRILASKREELDSWKTELIRHIGTNIRVLTDIVPGFEPILGPGNPVPSLPPDETRIRLITVLKGVLTAFSEALPPLVLFIDDLQWAPAEALTLLTDLLVDDPIPKTLFIGAFRTHTKESAPYLAPWLETFGNREEETPRLLLDGLDSVQIRQFASDTFHLQAADTDQLARLIEGASRGNPFFIREFLISLHEKGHIFFQKTWKFDLQEIGRLSLTDDVLELLGQRIEELSHSHQHILAFAACIGARFDSGFIARLTGQGEVTTEEALEMFTTRDLLVKEGSFYRFSHDKVHEAVSRRLMEEEKAALHHRIGTLLLETYGGKPEGRALFETITHLNQGHTLIHELRERITLSRLNLGAATAARTNAAFEAALRYAETGLDLLPQDPWEHHTDLAFALTVEAGEAAHLTERRDHADELLATALANTSSADMKALIYTITARSRIRAGEVGEAYTITIDALKAMGEKIPSSIGKALIFKELIKTSTTLWGKKIPTLVDLPELNDPEQVAVSRLYKLAFEVGYIAQPDHLPFLALKHLTQSLKHGMSAHSAFAAGFYGMMLISSGLSIEKGYQFGGLSLALIDKYPDANLESEVHLLFGGMICHWKRHYREGRPYLDHSLRCATETANFPMAAYSIGHTVILHQYLGASLIDSLPEFEKLVLKMDRLKQDRSREALKFTHQFTLNLTRQCPDFRDFNGPQYTEAQIEKKIAEKDQTAIANIAAVKGVLYFLAGDYDDGANLMGKAVPALPGIAGTLFVPDFHLFYGLNLAAIHGEKGRYETWHSLRAIKKSLKKLNTWAAHAPENFECRALLLQAELCRIRNKPIDAMGLYERAIAAAKENGFSQIEAVACECAFRFHLSAEREEVAKVYLVKAREAFTAWGALAKVAQLDEAWPHLLTANNQAEDRRITREPDLISIIKASQAIAGETDLSLLMEQLMTIVIENAGARVGSLILAGDDERLSVEARVEAGQTESPISPGFDALDTTAQGIIRYVVRTGKTVVLPQPEGETMDISFHSGKAPRSLLCMPLMEGSNTLGALYLENDLLEGAFTLGRVEILKTVTDILAHARARQKAEEEVALYQEKLRGLSSSIQLTEEKERRRIAVGLHDQIGQALTLSRLKLSTLKTAVPGQENKGELDQISGLVDQTIHDIRNLTFELSPPDLYDWGLAAALDTLAEHMLTPHGMKIDFEDALEQDPLPESARILLYQAAREVMFNIVKHAHATRVNIAVESSEGSVQVSITDNGVGFDIPETFARRNRTSGFGLFSIKERLAHHGGCVTITPGPASGTCVVLSLPI
ncbi:serine/threonine protein kinase [Desulfoluna limicola]|uniref:Serine/threonine protein kinase n=1 Tax=Desulfoluna limicola TaxID=2810562 RepID=A0ABM7PHY6_9BACT|nr:AAA family ATPase [Desulfoluna limicola]BCS96703.1 serine/threonine protein kinase [Desulfoluna limicola]